MMIEAEGEGGVVEWPYMFMMESRIVTADNRDACARSTRAGLSMERKQEAQR